MISGWIINLFRVEISPEYVYWRTDKGELENAVQRILETGTTDGIEISGINIINYWDNNHKVIEFSTSSFSNRGFYYSVDGVPASYQNQNMILNKKGDIWEWHEEYGDNHGSTKHIEGNWYTYKAYF